MSLKRERRRNAIFGWIIVPVIVIACYLVASFTMDQLCYAGQTERLPIYPNAEIIHEVHSGGRAWGVGETYMVIATDDPLETVRDWYGEHSDGAVLIMSREGRGFLLGMMDASYRVQPAAEGTGTWVILNGKCGT